MLDAVVSLGIGVLAGLGVGSGGLLMLYLTDALGLDQLSAQGLNLGIFVFALAAAVIVHLHRRTLPVSLLLVCVSFGVAGAAVGSGLATVVDAAWLRFSLGLLLLVMGTVALFRK